MRKNYNYGTLTNDILEYAPKRIIENGIQIINPTADIYIKHGYYPIIIAELPDEDKEYTDVYVLENNQIVQSWR